MIRVVPLAIIAAIVAIVLSAGMGVTAASADEEDPEPSLTEAQTAVVELHASVFRIMSLCESDVSGVTVQALPDEEEQATLIVVGRFTSSGVTRFDKLTPELVDSCVATARTVASADELSQLRASIIEDIDKATSA